MVRAGERADRVAADRAGWAFWTSLAIATAMALWSVIAIWLIARSMNSLTSPVELLTVIGASTAPLILGGLGLLAIRQSDTVARRRLAGSHAHIGSLSDGLDRAAATFARRVRDSSDELEGRAGRWSMLGDDLAARTGRSDRPAGGRGSPHSTTGWHASTARRRARDATLRPSWSNCLRPIVRPESWPAVCATPD